MTGKTMGDWVDGIRAVKSEAEAVAYLYAFAKAFQGEGSAASEVVTRSDYFGVVMAPFWSAAIRKVEPDNQWAAARLEKLAENRVRDRLNDAAPDLLAVARLVLADGPATPKHIYDAAAAAIKKAGQS